MRLLTFRHRHDTHAGLLVNEQIYALPWPDLAAAASAGREAIRQAAAAAQPIPLASVQIEAPIARPGKIIAVGLNYLDHVQEQNLTPPDRPTLFTKFSTAVNRHLGVIRWDPTLTQRVDYEAELAVIIGQQARRVPKAAAYDYIFGYTCLNDITARDLQRGDKQWVRGKSLDTFCPIGPIVVTPDELPDPHTLDIRCWVNEELRQASNTRHLIYDVPTLLEICAAAFTLEPGDIITTGTPGGVGDFRTPPTYLRPGDRLVVEIEGIGRLENLVGPYLTAAEMINN
ncbi:MAG: fumarylacetoacetate hydrolase family protein [Caldilineales bacterium]|nr:fumarylacetoacetate hydrolase family protein [Caldilineales bacterium]